MVRKNCIDSLITCPYTNKVVQWTKSKQHSNTTIVLNNYNLRSQNHLFFNHLRGGCKGRGGSKYGYFEFEAETPLEYFWLVTVHEASFFTFLYENHACSASSRDVKDLKRFPLCTLVALWQSCQFSNIPFFLPSKTTENFWGAMFCLKCTYWKFLVQSYTQVKFDVVFSFPNSYKTHVAQVWKEMMIANEKWTVVVW
jgi:hypothetical protein